MKKFRFALLALVVSAATFAFTPAPEVSLFDTVYAFDLNDDLIDSASSREELKNQLCPGDDEVFCAQVWTSKTIDNKPAGTQLANLEKPANP